MKRPWAKSMHIQIYYQLTPNTQIFIGFTLRLTIKIFFFIPLDHKGNFFFFILNFKFQEVTFVSYMYVTGYIYKGLVVTV